MPFNFWLVHTIPGGHIDGISGDCDLNKQRKIKWLTCPYGQGAPISPTEIISTKSLKYFGFEATHVASLTLKIETYMLILLSGCNHVSFFFCLPSH